MRRSACRKTIDRATLRLIQTPQAFAYTTLARARIGARRKKAGMISPTTPRLRNGPDCPVTAFAGRNRQYQTDHGGGFRESCVRAAAALLDDFAPAWASTFTPSATAIMSCSAAFALPHDRGLQGHSDADVVLHALVDAILGALGDGDIGAHFPPSDPQWRGAASDRFLQFASSA